MNILNSNNQMSLVNFKNIAFLTGLGICLWMFILLVGSVIFFQFNVTISTISVLILNIIFIFSYSLLLLKHENFLSKEVFLFWLIFFLILLVCGIFVSYFYDFSYDGQSYHGLAVYHLSRGWNLFKGYLPYEGTNIYINHYAQGSWIVYTCFYQMIQNFEFAKVVNLLFMIASWGVLLKLFQELKVTSWIAIAIATLIACHPVGLNMFLGMYVDGQMAACITLLIATFILLYLYPKNIIYQILLVSILAYLINIKFTGMVFALYFLGCFGLCSLLTKRFSVQIKNLVIGCVAILVGVLFIGYSSYVKNFINYQNIFYPLDVTQNTNSGGVLVLEPSNFKQQNRVLNLAQAIFAKTGFSNYYDNPIEYKFPFFIERKELERYAFSGVMIGGMGVWFSGILILSIALLVMSWIGDQNSKRKMYILSCLFIILGSCLMLEAPWWARYAPQFYLIPFVGILYYHWVFPFKFKIIYVMFFLLLVNSLLIVMPYTYYNLIVTQKQKKQFKDLQNTHSKYAVDFRNSEAQRVHFEQYNILYEKVSSNTFTVVPDTLFRSEVLYIPYSLK